MNKFADFLTKHWGEMLFAAEFVKKFIGKPGNITENAPPDLKRATGLIGSGDEIKLIITSLNMTENDVSILLGLLEYHFGKLNNPRNVFISAITFVQYNRWRTMVTDLDEPAKKVGTKKVVNTETLPNNLEANSTKATNQKKPKATKTETTQTELYSGVAKNTAKLIRRLIKIVKTVEEAGCGTDQEKREEGYDKAIAYMRSLNIPLMPEKSTLEWIDQHLSMPDVTNWTKEKYTTSHRWVSATADKNRTEEHAMSKWRQTLRSLL